MNSISAFYINNLTIVRKAKKGSMPFVPYRVERAALNLERISGTKSLIEAGKFFFPYFLLFECVHTNINLIK